MYNRTPLKLVKEHKEPVQLAYDAVGSSIADTGSIMYFTDLVQKNLPEYAVLQYPTIASVLGKTDVATYFRDTSAEDLLQLITN